MFKHHHALLPPTCNNLFNENRAFHNYPTRHSKNLRIPRVKSKLAENFITKQGVIIWNDLTANFDVNTSIHVFKRNIKIYLLNKY